MYPDKYIAERVEQYQPWYDAKSVVMKSRYLKMRAFAVVGGGSAPILVNVQSEHTFFDITFIQILVTIISLFIVIAVSLESVFHYREPWKTTDQWNNS